MFEKWSQYATNNINCDYIKQLSLCVVSVIKQNGICLSEKIPVREQHRPLVRKPCFKVSTRFVLLCHLLQFLCHAPSLRLIFLLLLQLSKVFENYSTFEKIRSESEVLVTESLNTNWNSPSLKCLLCIFNKKKSCYSIK